MAPEDCVVCLRLCVPVTVCWSVPLFAQGRGCVWCVQGPRACDLWCAHSRAQVCIYTCTCECASEQVCVHILSRVCLWEAPVHTQGKLMVQLWSMVAASSVHLT